MITFLGIPYGLLCVQNVIDCINSLPLKYRVKELHVNELVDYYTAHKTLCNYVFIIIYQSTGMPS